MLFTLADRVKQTIIMHTAIEKRHFYSSTFISNENEKTNNLSCALWKQWCTI